MAANSQSQAIGIANALLDIGVALAQLQDRINLTSAQYTQLTLGTTLGAFATCATNTDGSLGTADATPTSGHLIDVRVPALVGLQRAISAADLASLLTLLQAVAQVLSGGTPPAQQGQAPQILAKIVG